ncbi:MAG: AAA family ATPase [Bacteroidales bacterium]|nr:AAA family ATPase [Bacteroidales bacterium]
MFTVGFKNFRKFENFPAMELGDITMLVGPNNSGKSTFVKSILMLDDYFRKSINGFDLFFENGLKKEVIKDFLANQHFRFNGNYLAHIGTFKRALYNKASDNIISFTLYQDSDYFEIEVEGDPENEESVSGKIKTITIANSCYGFIMLINLQEDIATISISNSFKQDVKRIKSLDEASFRKLSSFCSSKQQVFQKHFKLSEVFDPFAIFNRLGYPSFIGILIQSFEGLFSALLSKYSKENSSEKEKANTIILTRELFGENKASIEFTKEEVEFLFSYKVNILENKQLEKIYLGTNRPQLRHRFQFPFSKFHNLNVEYIYAHAVNQTVIYSAKDSNDYLSKTINEFAPYSKDQQKRKFVVEWMKKFNIGIGYEITSVGGEAHTVKIITENGEKINLSDKGMGSIQIMTLLFRLAIKLKKGNLDMIIIEEPEQNLHPKLQSKLAELFYCINKKYQVRFLIETHSEYLIRKTQLLVKRGFEKNKNFTNPFKVYYFKENQKRKTKKHTSYYEMEYNKNGYFKNDFGPGFLDEAENLAYEIL